MKEKMVSIIGVIKSNKTKLIRLGVVVVILIAIVAVIFCKGYSNAEKNIKKR